MAEFVTRAECIDALQEAAEELGEAPTTAQYRELDFGPGVRTIQRRCGSWLDALEAAGFEGTIAQYDEADMAAAIREVNSRVDGLLTETKYRYARDEAHPTRTTIQRRTASFATFRDRVLADESDS